VFLYQRIDKHVEVAVHDVVKFIQRQVDAVVCYPALGKIVGSYTLGAIPASDLDSAGFRNFVVLFRLLLLQKSRL